MNGMGKEHEKGYKETETVEEDSVIVHGILSESRANIAFDFCFLNTHKFCFPPLNLFTPSSLITISRNLKNIIYIILKKINCELFYKNIIIQSKLK